MISHENKCIFIHIPKTAGTSLIKIFSDKNPQRKKHNPAPFSHDDYKFDPPPPHLRAQDYVKHGLVTKEVFDSYFKFSFVRNPWDRIISEYKYRGHIRKYPFKEYLFEHLPKPEWSDLYCHIIPQYDFLFDDQGNKLVNFIGKFETLQTDFEQICARLNLPAQKLIHENASLSIFRRRDNNLIQVLKSISVLMSINTRRNSFKSYQAYYDDESREFVSRLYKNDIETFDYHFGI